MPEETPQLQISPQEVQIEAPGFFDKLKLHKKKILIGAGVFFGVLALGGSILGAYLIGQRSIYPEPVEGPTPTPEVATPTPDPTADWETYTNTKVGFSFKYPLALTISECKEGLHLFESISGLKASEFCETPPLGKISLEYSVAPFTSGYSQSIEFEVKEEEIILGNTKAIKQTVKKIKEAPGPDYAVFVTFSKDNYYFLVSLRDKQYEDTFNLILSTFKFLEEEGKETYSFKVGKDIGYELKYPDDWNLEIVYCEKEQCGEASKYIEVVKISKDDYVFHLYSPIGFGMDFCFHPKSTPYPPFYEGPEGFNFGTFENYEEINSQYGNYVRGKTPTLGEFDGEEKYYLGVCNRERPEEHILEGIFVKYFLPSVSYDEEKIEVMDDILRSFHQLD